MKKKKNVQPTTLSILVKARNLIAKKGWTQKAFARNKYGHGVDPLSPGACKFCVEGALIAAGVRGLPSFSGAYRKLALTLHTRSFATHLAFFNDELPRGSKGKAEILKLFDDCISELK